jgi:hypothetical protein
LHPFKLSHDYRGVVVKSDIERMQNNKVGSGIEGIEIDRYGRERFYLPFRIAH